MDEEGLYYSIQHNECFKKAITRKNNCYFPRCPNKAINSHIFQKNGILSKIAKQNHIYEFSIDPFNKSRLFVFRRRGINRAFTFKGFCSKHDNDLFSFIEKGSLDFDSYITFILLALRAVFVEKRRKEINIEMFKCLKEKKGYDKEKLKLSIHGSKLGIKDLDFYIDELLKDLYTGSRSFIFKTRVLKRIDIVLSSYFTYQTTMEQSMRPYDRLSDIFINLFPISQDQSILIMGYHVNDENIVKEYINTFFKDKEHIVQRKVTNLLLFQCENWAISEYIYFNKIRPIEEKLNNLAIFIINSLNERRNFDVNIWRDDFVEKINFLEKNINWI